MKRSLILLTFLLCSSCATMINGRFQTVQVSSHPSGAQIEVDCGDAPRRGGVTPAAVTLHRAAEECSVTLSKEGYQTARFPLERQRSRAVGANKVLAVPVALVTAVVGGIIGEEVFNDGEGGVEAGFGAGIELGAAPGRQIDKHTGGAYKWVPGKVYLILIRPESESGQSR